MRRLFRGLLMLICACVPGCGQMKQGYMKRGISQTIAFCAILAVAIFLEIGALAVFLAPLWVYSFFDAYNLRRQILEGVPQEDEYLFGLSDMDSRRLEELLSKRHSLIGWVLVAVGLLVLWQNSSRALYNLLAPLFGSDDSWWLYDTLMHGIPRMVVTLLIIALGIWFIRGPKMKAEEDPIPDFEPEPFTAKGPYSPEAQVPVTLQLHPEEQEAPEPGQEEASHGDDR